MIFKSLLSAISWSVMVNAVPTDPTITPAAVLPRQADAAFIGWVSYNGTWTTETCDVGGTWYQSGGYAQCCPETVEACPAPTACVRGSQIYPLGSTTITTACTENYNNATYSICNTAFIFESFGDPSPKTDIVCGSSSQVWSYYRQVPASISAPSSSSVSPTPIPNSKGGSGSKAWIAGAVVGPVVGIALIAGVVFFLMRRKKNKQNNLPQAGGAATGPPSGVQHYTDAKPQPSNPSYGQAPPALTGYYSQQGYAQQPTSPAPQYQAPYTAPASPPPVQQNQQPYNAPASPPPQQSAYAAQDTKFGHTAQSPPSNAAELGGVSAPAGGQQVAELYSGERGT